jgi:hypothetical protein
MAIDNGADLAGRIHSAMDEGKELTTMLRSETLAPAERDRLRAERDRANAREHELRAAYDAAWSASMGPPTVTDLPGGRAISVGQSAGFGGGGRSTYLLRGSPAADAAIARRDAERAADLAAIRLAAELLALTSDPGRGWRVQWFGESARVTTDGRPAVIVEKGAARLAR